MFKTKLGQGGKRKWIAGAIKHPGALRSTLGVPQGEKIPASKLARAQKSSKPRVRQMANLARTLSGFNRSKNG